MQIMSVPLFIGYFSIYSNWWLRAANSNNNNNFLNVNNSGDWNNNNANNTNGFAPDFLFQWDK